MPVFSYLAYPNKGAKDQLRLELGELEYCEVLPADNEEILVLVTDTPNEKIEKDLKQKLGRLESLQSLGMTFGHTDR